jgi:CHAT domain-containing protein
MGVAHLASADIDRAAGLQLEALKLFEAVGDRRGEALAQYHLARAERARGNLDEAHARIRASVEIVESLRSNVASLQLRSTYLAAVQNYYEAYVDILMDLDRKRPSSGFAAAALEVSERARARGLLETLAEARADLRSGVDPDLLARERTLEARLNSAAQRRMQLLGRANTAEQVRAVEQEIARITAESDEVRSLIRTRSPRYAALTQPVPSTVREIQNEILDADTTLLEYFLGAERSFVWMVSSNAVESRELPGRDTIESAARRFYRAVAEEGNAWQETARDLARLILEPVRDRLLTKRLVIVPGGALQYVPFAAMGHPSFSDYRPLILDHEILYLPSASTLAVLRRETAGRPRALKTLAAIADPVFRRDDSRVRSKNNEGNDRLAPAGQRSGETETVFARLLGTRREADAILALAPVGSRLRAVDFEANRELVTSGTLAEYRLVHFATHGIFDSHRPELSGVVLSMVDKGGETRDGILRLHDIYNLELPADLVVLSACRTALGRDIKGEGLVGLTRGFMYAGAPRVLASLWKVDDRATSFLMKHFYRALLDANGRRPSEALRDAQASVMREKRWQHPYYWSAFIMQGEWR